MPEKGSKVVTGGEIPTSVETLINVETPIGVETDQGHHPEDLYMTVTSLGGLNMMVTSLESMADRLVGIRRTGGLSLDIGETHTGGLSQETEEKINMIILLAKLLTSLTASDVDAKTVNK